MKILGIIACLFFCGCINENQKNAETQEKNEMQKDPKTTEDSGMIYKPELSQVIQASKVKGSILILDPAKEVFYSNDFEWAKIGRLPASTFKIPNSIIGLETGVIKNENAIFNWDGQKRGLPVWEQDLNVRQAFQYSCVPCYQEVAKKIGMIRMNEYLEKLNYGQMVLDTSDIDVFWLMGESKISQFEQIDFLRRLYEEQLPISLETYKVLKEILIVENGETADGQAYVLSGKTGWAVRNGHNNGWFVGYVEIGPEIYYFATNITPDEEFNLSMFSLIRKQITIEGLQKMKII